MKNSQGTDWPRLFYSLIIFIALLVVVQLLLPRIDDLNARLGDEQVQAGYVAAMQGMILLLWLVAGAMIAVMLARGIVVAPLAWIVELCRIGITSTDPWYAVGDSLIFVSPQLNFALMALIPPLVGIAWWWAAGQLAWWPPLARFARIVQIPALWFSLVLVTAVANWFLFRWATDFRLAFWPSLLGWTVLIPGMILAVGHGLNRPWYSLALLWGGLLLPVAFLGLVLGLYDGLLLGLSVILPVASGSHLSLWLELTLLFALPLLLVVACNQLWLWRKGRPLMTVY